MKEFLGKRFDYLFRSTKGLTLVAIAMVALVTAIWGTLSGPMVEWGIRDITVKVLGMDLHQVDREGRLIMLYHTLAMAVIAIEVYFITEIVPMKRREQVSINAVITIGYLLAMIFGLGFAYFGHNFAFHGLFLVGQTLIFFAGLMLLAALWPWQEKYLLPEGSPYSRSKKGVDLERVAFFAMAAMTLTSSIWGATTGSFWGNGHETFLGEDIIRHPDHTALQKAIIGHLHIMVSLVASAITLIVGKWLDFKGKLHQWGIPMGIFGIIVLTAGALAIVWIPWAHTIIYFGAVFIMMEALFFVIYSWDMLIRTGTEGIEKPSFIQKMAALFRDPLKFGVGWQMVFMNFTVSGVGIFLAVRLDKVFRVWPHREERITLTGHWHVLAALIATIIIMYYVDLSGIKGKMRNWFGWLLIISSDVAFGAATIFSMKRLFVDAAHQQTIVNNTMLAIDFGLGIVLVIFALFMIWRLYDLFQDKGLWEKEFSEEKQLGAKKELEEQKRKLAELEANLKEVE
ncbi:MAG: hypothetical protein B6I38_03470 [Anaerolineaceae bacterium 4572_5.1]|nr:MAG: hypothetical protein B6I38_03470 [Anaerolineaceae bacterium 4572_5.1]